MISRPSGLVLSLAVIALPLFGSTEQYQVATGGQPCRALSPDGKWVFEANWCKLTFNVNSGYLCDLKKVADGHLGFADQKPTDNNTLLPRRMSVNWSLDSRYASIFYYYGRALAGSVVVALQGSHWVEVDVPPPGHPRHMILPRDRGRWVDGSEIKTSFGPWENDDTITLTDTMHATLTNPDGTKDEVDSTRDRVIKFTGTIGKVITTTSPQY